MSRITFTAEENHESYLSELEQRDDIDSTAAAVRHCIEVAEESQQRDAELQQRVEELQQENERLQRKLTAANNRHEEVTELVEYVEEQREIENYRARRERIVDKATLGQRLKWKFTGVPVDDLEG